MLTKITPDDAIKIFDKIWEAVASSLYCKVDDVFMRECVRIGIERGKLHVWVGVEEDKIVGILLTTFIYQSIEGHLTLLIYAAYIADSALAYVRKNYKVLNQFAVEANCISISFYTNNPKLASFAARIGGHQEYHLSVPVLKGGD